MKREVQGRGGGRGGAVCREGRQRRRSQHKGWTATHVWRGSTGGQRQRGDWRQQRSRVVRQSEARRCRCAAAAAAAGAPAAAAAAAAAAAGERLWQQAGALCRCSEAAAMAGPHCALVAAGAEQPSMTCAAAAAASSSMRGARQPGCDAGGAAAAAAGSSVQAPVVPAVVEGAPAGHSWRMQAAVQVATRTRREAASCRFFWLAPTHKRRLLGGFRIAAADHCLSVPAPPRCRQGCCDRGRAPHHAARQAQPPRAAPPHPDPHRGACAVVTRSAWFSGSLSQLLPLRCSRWSSNRWGSRRGSSLGQLGQLGALGGVHAAPQAAPAARHAPQGCAPPRAAPHPSPTLYCLVLPRPAGARGVP